MSPEIRKALNGILNPGKGTIVKHRPIGSAFLEITPHGHVVARKDAFKVSCGGEASCNHCQEERRYVNAGTYPIAPEDFDEAVK